MACTGGGAAPYAHRSPEELRADRSEHDALRAEKTEMEARFEEEIGRTEQVRCALRALHSVLSEHVVRPPFTLWTAGTRP